MNQWTKKARVVAHAPVLLVHPKAKCVSKLQEINFAWVVGADAVVQFPVLRVRAKADSVCASCRSTGALA